MRPAMPPVQVVLAGTTWPRARRRLRLRRVPTAGHLSRSTGAPTGPRSAVTTARGSGRIAIRRRLAATGSLAARGAEGAITGQAMMFDISRAAAEQTPERSRGRDFAILDVAST